MLAVGVQGVQEENRDGRSKESGHVAGETAFEKGERGVRGSETQDQQQSESTVTQGGDPAERHRVHRGTGSVAAEQQSVHDPGLRYRRDHGRSSSAIRDGTAEAVLGPVGNISTHRRFPVDDGVAVLAELADHHHREQPGPPEHDRPEHRRAGPRDHRRRTPILLRASLTTSDRSESSILSLSPLLDRSPRTDHRAD